MKLLNVQLKSIIAHLAAFVSFCIGRPRGMPGYVQGIALTVGLLMSGVSAIGQGVFVTGHDPDFHAVLGGNVVGARRIIQRGIAYVTNNKANPGILLVTDLRNPGGVQCDSRLGLIQSGYTTFDVADYGSGQQGALDLNTVNFSDYDVIVIASDFGGWLRQVELDILNARKEELIAYVNNGGGLVAFAESGQNIFSGAPPPATTTRDRFGFLPFLISGVSLDQHESNITVTPAGTALGLTNFDVNGNFSHNYFATSGGMDIIDVDGHNRIITLATRQHITTDGVGHLCSATVTVPGTANPWLAGMPAGSTAINGDSAPRESPIQVTGLSLTSGTQLSFSATGSVSYGGGSPQDPPDGRDSFAVSHLFYQGLNGVENGIATVVAPANALMGLFLDDSQPTLTAAPTGINFYATSDGRNYPTLVPGLKQPFFIGDGTTTTGAVQKFVVPVGATRLFLGTMDGSGWFNNTGAFTVTVTGPCADATTEPPVITGGLPADGGIFIGTTTPGRPGFVTGTITGTGHPDCTIQVTVSDPHHPVNNFMANTTVDAEGNWYIEVELADCDPIIEFVQICNGVASTPVSSHIYVDGTSPVFVNGGPGDGVSYTSGGIGGTVNVVLSGAATDTGSFIPGNEITYQWHLIDSSGAVIATLGGGGSYGTLLNGGSGLSIDLTVGEYIIEEIVTDTAGNQLIRRCHRHVFMPITITGGVPTGGVIFGAADALQPGQTTGTISGTGHPGCTIEVTVSDPSHPESIANNSTYTTTADANGNWSITLTLDDCDPTVSVVQICEGVRGAPTSWQVYVDGTPPVFTAGGPADGIDYIGTDGIATIMLDGSASDPGSHAPGELTYEWALIGEGGVRTPLGTGPTLALPETPGEYTIEVIVTDPAGNELVKRCIRRVEKRPTTLDCGESTVIWGAPIILSAKLIDGLTNGEIAGKTISYKLNGEPVSSPISLPLLPGEYVIIASFVGDEIYQPSTATHDCRINITATPGKITGGGSIDERVRSFGFIADAKSKNGVTSYSGNIEFQDKSQGIDLKSDSISLIAISPDRMHAVFTGTASVNQKTGYSYTVWIDDLAEPGAEVDKFRIEIKGPAGFLYDSQPLTTKAGVLDKGGNIQIHKP